jgi:hypothetical protein
MKVRATENTENTEDNGIPFGVIPDKPRQRRRSGIYFQRRR